MTHRADPQTIRNIAPGARQAAMHGSTVSAALANGLLTFAVSRGASRASVLQAAGVSEAALADPDARIALAEYRALMHAAQRACADPALALTWGAAVDMADVSIVGLIMNASRTMGEAFAQMQRFSELAVDVETTPGRPRFVLDSGTDGLWMVDTRPDPDAFPELTEIAFARLVCGPRRFLDRPHVLAVHVTHARPEYADRYREVFRCPVTFGSDRNALRLHPEVGGWPVQRQPGYVLDILTGHAERLLDDLRRRGTFRADMEARMLPALHTGTVSADRVAEQLGISRMTLHRRLAEEGTRFGEVLDALRLKLAQEYLLRRGLSVNETAYLLGYSEPSAFSRAFKRWTGERPRAWVERRGV
jgi:AraC-like DNA-binding protein